MTFKTQMAADVAVFINTDEFGTSATYEANGTGARSTVDVVLDPSLDLAMSSPGQAALATIMAKKAQVPAPTRYDLFIVDGVEWRVDQVLADDGVVITMSASSDHRVKPQGVG